MTGIDRAAAMRSTRRTLLRAAGLGGLAAATGGLLAACSTAAPSAPRSSPAAGTTTAPRSEGPSPMTTASQTPEGRVLIAYYSRPGENYWYGGRRNLTTGNTEVLAGLLADRIDADVFRIEAQDAYSDDYDDTVDRNVREQRDDARPAIAGDLPSLDGYDAVLVGSPIWNVRPPMIMSTFLEAADWAGTDLLPFVTYAVSGLGSTERDYRAVARGARVRPGLAVLGETVQDAAGDAEAWLRRSGLL